MAFNPLHRPTVGDLITRYAHHYPATDKQKPGKGTRRLSLEAIKRKTGIPRSTLGRWMNDEVDFDLLVKVQALCAGLKIPRDEMDQAVLPLGE